MELDLIWWDFGCWRQIKDRLAWHYASWKADNGNNRFVDIDFVGRDCLALAGFSYVNRMRDSVE